MTSAPQIFTSEYYARLAQIEESHYWSLGMRAIATRLLDHFAPRERNWRVLDAGCGTGLTLNWVKCYTDCEPVGFDLSRAALEYSARRGHTRLMEATTLRLPLPSDYFDLVISTDVIQHLPRPHGDAQALGEMVRVLKHDGLLLIRTNSHCGYPATDEPDYRRYKLSDARALVENAGFKIHTATYVNCVPALLITLRRKLTFQNGSQTDPGLAFAARPPQTNWVTRFLYQTLLAESVYLAPGGRALPFGHSIIVLAEKI